MRNEKLLETIIEIIRDFNRRGIIPNSFQIAKELKDRGIQILIEKELPDGYDSPEINALLR